jgi:N-acetylglucosamine-6-phosphate deacetylase
MLVIENGTLYTPTRVIPDGAVLVDGQRIQAIGRCNELAIPTEARRLDASGGSIVPGFVNMHIHGVGGYGSLDGQVASLQAMSLLLTRHGVTSWVPTIGSSPLDVKEAALVAIRQVQHTETVGAEILGGHVEGPYLNVQERGAMPPDLLRAPRPEEYYTFLQYADVIRVFTLAPELPGALDLISALKERGILVSVGHSIAIDVELSRAVDAGLSHATHMFCNMGTLRRVNLRRVAGLVESVLLDDRVTAEIITDGYIIAPSLMKLALKVKGPQHLAIVTDGSSLTGLPPGSYSIRGRDLILEEEIVHVVDRSAYAGSVATMDHCLRVAIEIMDVSLPDALRMVSLTPATILGVADHKGSLETGKDADIVILDDNLHVAHTVAGGRIFDAKLETRIEEGGEFGWRVAL